MLRIRWRQVNAASAVVLRRPFCSNFRGNNNNDNNDNNRKNNSRNSPQSNVSSAQTNTEAASSQHWRDSEAFWRHAKYRQRHEFDDSSLPRVRYNNSQNGNSAWPVRRLAPETLLLVRHGQSMANVDTAIYRTTSDHAIQLSDEGRVQAADAGKAIAEFYRKRLGGRRNPPHDWHCRAWVSPYVRTRETASIMAEHSQGWVTDLRESIFLVEQQFGLFEGRDWSSPELEREFAKELEYYKKAASFGGRFWAKVPLGESRFDVAMRMHQMFGSIHRDAEQYGLAHHVIVSHGLSLRAFAMMWTHQTPEWLEVEPNFQNGAIRLLTTQDGDCGYIHRGAETSRVGPDFLLNNGDDFEEGNPPILRPQER